MDRTRSVAGRASLESAVQLGRGDEVNSQAERADPSKCRESVQLNHKTELRGGTLFGQGKVEWDKLADVCASTGTHTHHPYEQGFSLLDCQQTMFKKL
jgi:hypothetical protein